jgi:hypothetical protein
MSTRGTILDTLATQLATITTANGYNSEVEKVFRSTPNIEALASKNAYLTIVDAGPDAHKQYCDGNKKVAEMLIQIYCQVRGAAADGPPTDAISDIISDLRELIESPISLGANVRFVEVGDIPQIFTVDDPPEAAIYFPIAINYWYDADSP